MSTVDLRNADCLAAMRALPDNSVDVVLTDPPYGLGNTTAAQVTETIIAWTTGDREFLPSGRGFMGKEWDAFVPPVAVWDEAMRVLKPGGHMAVFSGARTVDLMGLGIRLAGFEIRDVISWIYGSGFPKSMDVSKAIDKAGGDALAFRRFAKAYAKAVTESPLNHSAIDSHLGIKSSSCYWAREDHRGGMPPRHHWDAVRELLDLPANLERLYDEAEREVVGSANVPEGHAFAGAAYGNSRAMKTVDITAPATDAAKTWAGWGTALKPAHEPIILARKPLAAGTVAANVLEYGTGALNIDASRIPGVVPSVPMGTWTESGTTGATAGRSGEMSKPHTAGRFPANVILDESQAEVLDAQSGITKSGAGGRATAKKGKGIIAIPGTRSTVEHTDAGGASRFFYVAKAGKKERPVVDGVAHPTVKPLSLIQYLARLITPPGGVVLEPFAGSGTTVEACILEGFDVIAIERDPSYIPLIQARIDRATPTEELEAAA